MVSLSSSVEIKSLYGAAVTFSSMSTSLVAGSMMVGSSSDVEDACGALPRLLRGSGS